MTSTKAFSVAINGNHIVEEQHAYISSFSQISMHVDLRLCGSHLWLPKKNTHATEKIPQMDPNHVRYQLIKYSCCMEDAFIVTFYVVLKNQ